ncbi:hypothetical protein PHLGIDRAFT_105771 [Phlebiopsis gigantea 11061_1 CR5-6]|uniref:Polyketide synthase phosphopantetheine-binding domain-containing protein n=1 Tax=Phlebiopsis gigantea (strain 11061_1 CR5-6) TaxID=745531 RepID=A0A0C3RYW5_PHLG1|nr:hypothetical protein PHLGIDRAFT_105771 [Phlebiopsis gigantea 11061_1 CR5-6]
MSARLTFPPSDGSVSVIPGFVDFQAHHNADRPWVLFPSGSPVGSISFREFADATHRVAHHFCPDKRRVHGEVVALIINCDVVLYLAVVCGLVRAGFIPFLMGPKNSVPAFINMVKKTSCCRIISQPAFSPLVQAIASQLKEDDHLVQVDYLPHLNDIFPKFGGVTGLPDIEPFPSSDVIHHMDDIVMYLHSSGSTGYPKPISQRQNFLLEYSNNSVAIETRRQGMIWAAMALPAFHSIALLMQLLVPLSSSHPICLFYPVAPALPALPTPEALLAACKATPTNGLPAFPAFFEFMTQSKEGLNFLASLKIAGFAGGNLTEEAAAKAKAAGIHPFAVYGGTEFGAFTMLRRTDGHAGPDWEWMAFDERLSCRWIPQGDGSYELQFLTCATHHPAVENLPDARGFATRDLFVPHPTQSGLWRVVGRKDDIIVLNIGEKIAPVLQEGVIISSPVVAGCVMFGRGKSECGILVEPIEGCTVDVSDEDAVIQFRNQIWPTVEKANALAPGYARIFKEMILIARPEKALPRAAKGTVIRAQALAAYKEEIEAILHVTFLRNRILATLRSSSDYLVQQAASYISPSFIFEHPTLRELANGVAYVVSNGDGSKQDLESDIRQMIDNYANHLPRQNPPLPRLGETGITVMLIGSTGGLGSHILATLLREPKVRLVYTVNRSSLQDGRQISAFRKQGLPVDILSSPKLVQLCGDFTEETFGLEPSAFEHLRSTVTYIVHNAWRVDFNLPLSSFERYVAGTRRLVDLCSFMERPARLLFTSSVASVQKWDVAAGSVPEEVISNVSTAAANGYGASKFVAEHILGKAAENGLDCTVLRLGQTCGPSATGAWATTEWVPILVKSSIALGMLPALDGYVSWIPMDAVADIVGDLVLSEKPSASVLNVAHPRPVPWRTIFDAINVQLGTEPLRTVPYRQWLDALREAEACRNAQDLEQIPAVKIVQFFEAAVPQENVTSVTEAGGLPMFQLDQLLRHSPAANRLEPLDGVYAARWIRYWKDSGYLS